MTAGRTRRTQRERSETTRAKLMDATVQCLVELGYAATTIAEIQDRAGVARGTLLHHFPAKSDIFVAAMSHLATTRIARFRREAELIPPAQNRFAALVDLAWRDLNSPTFFAALELWVAARTDTELRDALIPVERELFAGVHEPIRQLVGERFATDPRTATLTEFTIDVLTGLSMSTILTSNLGSRELLLRRWKRALAVLYGDLDAAELIEGKSPATVRA